jgi:hypothetical protein
MPGVKLRGEVEPGSFRTAHKKWLFVSADDDGETRALFNVNAEALRPLHALLGKLIVAQDAEAAPLVTLAADLDARMAVQAPGTGGAS